MSQKLRTVFWGTPQFAIPALESTKSSSNLLGIVTQPDRPSGRGQKVQPCDVKARANEWGLPAFSPASLRKPSEELSDLWAWLRSHEQIDLFVVVAYGNILPQEILDFPRFGSINIHGSLLPLWRGAAPIQRSLENGDLKTGICIQKMLYELDAGNILASSEIQLSGNENTVELSQSLSSMGALALSDLLSKIAHANKMDEGQKQDPTLVSFAPKISKEEGFWNNSWSAKQTHNKVRAFFAWPSVKIAVFLPDAKRPTLVKLKKTLPVKTVEDSALFSLGEIFISKKTAYLKCAEGSVLELLQVQPENSKNLSAHDYFQNIFTKYQIKSLKAQTPSL